MSMREVLILLSHAEQCHACRSRLFGEPAKVFSGRALTQQEIEMLSLLAEEDFIAPERLARAVGVSLSELSGYRDHPVVRLRHF